MRFFLILLTAALFTGCTTFRPAQKDAFIDDDGNILVVEYGEASKPYTYTMVSPMNGVEVECTDRKMVRLDLPDGKRLVCYICQNAFRQGTMYQTRDKKWKYLTIGLACRLFRYDPAKNDYLLVYEGNICPSALDEVGR